MKNTKTWCGEAATKALIRPFIKASPFRARASPGPPPPRGRRTRLQNVPLPLGEGAAKRRVRVPKTFSKKQEVTQLLYKGIARQSRNSNSPPKLGGELPICYTVSLCFSSQ